MIPAYGSMEISWRNSTSKNLAKTRGEIEVTKETGVEK